MSKYALIGISPKTKEVCFLASADKHLQEHWDDLNSQGLIPAIVPTEVARKIGFTILEINSLTDHIYPSPFSTEIK